MAVKTTTVVTRICDFCKSPGREAEPYVLSAPVRHHRFDICDLCRTTVTIAQVQERIAAEPGGAVRNLDEQLPFLLKLGEDVAAKKLRT